MTGWAESYGAITVVNAIPCGRGCTLGIELKTVAEFVPGDQPIQIEVMEGENTDLRLAEACAVNMHDSLGRSCGGSLKIWSDIPVSRGLKSSSSAANAICLAINDAYGRELDDMDAIRIGCLSSIDAKVSVTGAFDDACGCHFGGLVATDNVRMVVESMLPSVGDHRVLLHIPSRRIEKSTLDLPRFKERSKEFDNLIKDAVRSPFRTLIENGRMVAEMVGADDSMASRALDHGAIAAGLTGTGPAIAIIADDDVCERIIEEEGAEQFILSRLREAT